MAGLTTLDLEAIAARIRLEVARSTYRAQSGHFSSALSSVNPLVSLYFGGILKHDPNVPRWEGRDRFVLSKGHAAPALYATLALCGYFPIGELDNLRCAGAMLQGHPSLNTHGIDAPTGILGYGIALAGGMAKAMQGSNRQVYVIVGDGELSTPFARAAPHLYNSLENLTLIVDCNGFSSDHEVPGNFKSMSNSWRRNGWGTNAVRGESIEKVISALNLVKNDDRPTVVFVKTKKGQGSRNEGQNLHGVPATITDVNYLENRLDQAIDRCDEHELYPRIDRYLRSLGSSTHTSPLPEKISFTLPEVSGKTPREVFGSVLPSLAQQDPKLRTICADLEKSLKLGDFKKDHPELHIDFPIDEPSMMVMAVGLALSGLHPVVAGFGEFFNSSHTLFTKVISPYGINVKVVASHGGLDVGEDGDTHQEFGLIHTLQAQAPGIKLFEPADARQTRDLLERMMSHTDPAVIRFPRSYSADLPAPLRRESSFNVLGSGKDATIIASGVEVREACKAVKLCLQNGKSIGVINLFQLDYAAMMGDQEKLQSVIGGRPIVTVYDGVQEVLELPIRRIAGGNPIVSRGVNHGESGKAEDLRRIHGLDAKGIAQAVEEVIEISI